MEQNKTPPSDPLADWTPPASQVDLDALSEKVEGLERELATLAESHRVLEVHRDAVPEQLLGELHAKVFAAVDARPPAPQLYKIDPDFLDRFDKLEARANESAAWIDAWDLKAVQRKLDHALAPVLERLSAVDTTLHTAVAHVVDERVGRLRNVVADRFAALEQWVGERLGALAGAAAPGFALEQPTNQTPATPQAIEEFREQLAARSLPELGELEAYEPELPELAPLGEIGKIIEGATLKPELATEPQQESEPVTQQEPAESASGEPQENA